MYLRKAKTKNGRIHISITQSYRNEEGKPTHKTIETLGYLDILAANWDVSEEEALKRCKNKCRAMTEEYNKKTAKEYIEIKPGKRVDIKKICEKNLGSAVPLAFYNTFGVESCIRNKFNKKNTKFDANAIMRLLVIERLLNPRSRRSAYQNKDDYFFKSKFNEIDMCRACKIFPQLKNITIRKINECIDNLGYRNDLCNVFYDVTNYYFEIDNEDELRRLGKGKENTKTPIIQMGLLQDKNALPITYKLFPGNTNDYVTMLPLLEELKSEYKLKKVTIVADKGNNTSTNIALSHLNGDGFIFSQSIRGTKSSQNLKNWVINNKDYQVISNKFKIKSKIGTKKIHISKNDSADNKDYNEKITVKYVAYWSEKFEKRARHKREKQIEKAKELIKLKSKNIDSKYYSAAKYIKDYDVDTKTGEVKDAVRNYELNTDLIEQEKECDGYYCIVTNRTDLSDNEIIKAYRGLWQIEESFKITKSELKTRPIYANSEEGIYSHFLICYIALVIARLIQLSLDKEYSVRKIFSSLKKCNGTLVERNWWIFGYRTELTDLLYELVGIPKQLKYIKLYDIKKYFKKNLFTSI